MALAAGIGGLFAAKRASAALASTALAVGVASTVLNLGIVLYFNATGNMAGAWAWWMIIIYIAVIAPSAVLGGRIASPGRA
jgi:hypothetical protein